MPGARFNVSLVSILLYVHIGRIDYQGRGAYVGHLGFHTAPDLCPGALLFQMLLYVHRGHKDG